MSETDHVRELLDLARDRSVAARMTLVDTIGDLFSEKQTVLTERERALMTDILEKLVRDFELEIRRQLSDRLSDKPRAPHALIKMLADDEIEVARPVLMHSEVLRERELIEIVRNRTRQHQLAIAVRSDIGPALSDALVGSGDDDVIGTLLNNPNAEIAQATMAYLVDQARTRDSFHEPLVRRVDLSDALAGKLFLYVSAALRQDILDRFDIPATDLDDLLETMATELARERARTAGAGERDAAWRLAGCLEDRHGLDAGLMVRVLRAGEVALFEALFGRLSGLRPPRLQHVLYETGGKGLAVACRALEIDKASFAPIFLLSRKGRGGDQVVDPREVSRVMSYFDRVKVAAARDVLRGWQRDPAYQDAIAGIEEARRAAKTVH
jgi:uncharacterized protein (DUF2336 family)